MAIVGGTLGKVDRYLRSIRNPAKRQYANAYAAFVLGNTPTPPQRPGNLSVMGAQAVELRLRELTKQRDDDPAPVTLQCELGNCHRCRGTVISTTAAHGRACRHDCHDGNDLAIERALEVAHFEEV